MCNSSLEVWENTVVHFFAIFLLSDSFSCLKKKKKNCVKYELSYNCDLHFIGLLKVLNSSSLSPLTYFGQKRLHLFFSRIIMSALVYIL
jgi:hypothetical protein